MPPPFLFYYFSQDNEQEDRFSICHFSFAIEPIMQNLRLG
jgi:hypothetical protein